MEHSFLHALQLLGLLGTLGGALFSLLILKPARRATAAEAEHRVGRFVLGAGLMAAAAGILNVFVQVAELEGGSVYGGVHLESVRRFLIETTVGALTLGKIGLLLGAAGLAAIQWPGKWILCAVAAGGAGVCGGLVSHAAALPNGRGLALAGQLIHLGAAALWLGMLAHLWRTAGYCTVSEAREQFALLREMVRRFSPFALLGVILLGGSGLYTAYRFVREPTALVLSAYGLTLLLKLTFLLVAFFAGYQNWRVVRPALLRAERQDAEWAARFRRWTELELSAGVLAVVLAGIVGSISPPGVDGAARLNARQVSAVISLELPPTNFVDPASFVGAETRTVQDLRYSEFTHRWSGVLVILLGLLWLGQSNGGDRMRRICGWCWPALLVPFGFFVAIFADPEPWLMQKMTLGQMMRSAEIIEHQLGAMLVFLLVVFGLRDQKRPPLSRPLGYALPVIMMLGSLMLLGHAHSNLRMSEELSSLINAQHAVLGGCGLLAGFARWLQLRGIFSGPWARLTWPVGVTLLGVAMAFFYTEVF